MANIAPGSRTVRVNMREDMALFDTLPPQIRAWMRNAVGPFSARQVKRILDEARGDTAKAIRRLNELTQPRRKAESVADLF